MMYFSYLVATGVTTGALYALVALGIVVVFRATNVVNFAHGEMFMLAGFLAWTAHVALKLPYVPSLLIAVAIAFALGVLVYRIAFQPLMKTDTLNARCWRLIGLSFILKGVARYIWGGKGDYIPLSAAGLADADRVRRHHGDVAAARRARCRGRA